MACITDRNLNRTQGRKDCLRILSAQKRQPNIIRYRWVQKITVQTASHAIILECGMIRKSMGAPARHTAIAHRCIEWWHKQGLPLEPYKRLNYRACGRLSTIPWIAISSAIAHD